MREFRFHNNFMLNRDRLSAMFRCVAEDPAAAKESIAAAMGVNPYMVEGFRGWLCKTGPGSFARKTYTISTFGQIVARYDPYLEQPGTLWGLHYHLATSQQGERAEVKYRPRIDKTACKSCGSSASHAFTDFRGIARLARL